MTEKIAKNIKGYKEIDGLAGSSAALKMLADDLYGRLVEEMNEDTGWGVALADKLEGKADKSALQTIWSACEKSFASRNLEHIVSDLVEKLDTMPSQQDVIALSNFLTAHVNSSPSHNDLLSSINLLSSNVGKLNSAVTALAAKLDTDFTAQNSDVTGSTLDVDYETTVTSTLT